MASDSHDAVLRAEDIAPSAFASQESQTAAELASLGISKADDLDYDEAHLTAHDSHPLERGKLSSAKKREKYLASITRDNVQLLLRRVFALPYDRTEDGPMAIFPPPRSRLPRRLPVPEEKEETRWERFAREKGIKKQKRSRMVWDEQWNEWRPRYGYKVGAPPPPRA
jgi:regulator of ribosome biosynthesis